VGVGGEERDRSRGGELKMDWTKPLQDPCLWVLFDESERTWRERAIGNDGNEAGGLRFWIFSGPAKGKAWNP
jgi:hypothetical protein